jgi:transposase-like protein
LIEIITITKTAREEPMVQRHSRTPQDYVQWVSTLLAQQGSYGAVSALSQQVGVARQTLYRWKAKGEAALQAVFTQAHQGVDQQCPLERAILTLLVEGHASYRGIQQCLWTLLGQQVSLGKIAAVVQSAGKLAQNWISHHAPDTRRSLALDELYGSKHGEAYQSAG